MEKEKKSENPKMFLPPSVQHLFAGTCGGVCATFAGHPFDTIKVRLQTMPKPKPGEKPMFGSAWDCVRCTVKSEGVLALYRGLVPPLAIAMPTTAVVFWSFNKGKSLQGISDSSKELMPHQIFLAGAFAGLCSQVLMVPGERVKCLLQIQRDSKGKNKYRGPWDCVKQIYREEGIRGMYRGTGVGLLRDIPGLGMFFMSYECSLKLMTPKGRSRDSVGPIAIASAGGIAGLCVLLLALPQDVLKSRYQTAPVGMYPRGMRDVFRVTIKEEGFRALWKGMTPAALRAIPTSSAVYLGYEFGMRFLHWSVPHLAELSSGIFFD